MDTQIGEYRLDHLIGQGATGEVWLAWEESALRRPVALKRLRPEATGTQGVTDLAEEAEVLAGIHHPHLVPVIAVVQDGEDVAIVMPYLAGGSLAGLLEERGTLSPGEVVAVIEPLAEAVDALARRWMVHGDLKPGNVMLTGDGEPVLVDAGLTRVANRGQVGPTTATAEYLDPTLIQGRLPDAASEVYSLGVIAYECLTGRVPHRGEPAEVVAVAAAGVHRRLHSWPTVPRAVADVVEVALDPDPTRRPGDAGAFAALLREAVEGESHDLEPRSTVALPGISRRAIAAPDLAAGHQTVVIAASPAEAPDPVGSSRGRWRRPVGAAAFGLVALLSVLALRPHDGSSAAPPSPSPSGTPTATPLAAKAAASCAGTAVEPPEVDTAPAVSLSSPTDVRVDVDGDGCPDLVRWDGHRLTVTSTATAETRAYRLGRPGDQVLFGDWDGDGAATPAVYRPSTGEVLHVDRFPSEIGDRETAVRVEHLDPGGTAEVWADESQGGPGRDRVVLTSHP